MAAEKSVDADPGPYLFVGSHEGIQVVKERQRQEGERSRHSVN